MKKEFALEPGSPKRLKITYPGNLASAEVLLDGQRIMAFSSKADFQRGLTCKLPDNSVLTVRYGPIEGVPLLKGVHVIRNGAPLPGSAADPVPKWAWVFIDRLCADSRRYSGRRTSSPHWICGSGRHPIGFQVKSPVGRPACRCLRSDYSRMLGLLGVVGNNRGGRESRESDHTSHRQHLTHCLLTRQAHTRYRSGLLQARLPAERH